MSNQIDWNIRRRELWNEAVTDKPGAVKGRKSVLTVLVIWIILRVVTFLAEILGVLDGSLKFSVLNLVGLLFMLFFAWLIWQGARPFGLIMTLGGVVSLFQALAAGYVELMMLYGDTVVRLYTGLFLICALFQVFGMLYLFFGRQCRDFFDVRQQISRQISREMREDQRSM